jgi:hypothetical protein
MSAIVQIVIFFVKRFSMDAKFNSKHVFLWLVKPKLISPVCNKKKKFRQIHKLFIAEGAKVIQELTQIFLLEHLYVTEPIF